LDERIEARKAFGLARSAYLRAISRPETAP
jgi:hypothetical protein